MKPVVFIMLASCAAVAQAEPASAQRYKDAQGVEIIQNRDAPRPGPLTASAPPSVRTAAANNATMDGRLRISPAEQAARDKDRVAILQEELAHETQKFEETWRALAGAAAGKPGPDAGRIKEELNEHQRNIQSINAELRRTRGALSVR